MEIVGVGNALMDVIAGVGRDFAPSRGFENGATLHLDHARIAPLLAELPHAAYSAGGGAANTVRIASILGMKGSFHGALGADLLGRRYRAELGGAGVELHCLESPKPTGIFCALLQPSGQRTILVAPGAALDLCLEPPPDSLFAPDAILYLEGFLLRDEAWFLSLIGKARERGMRVALDLGSAGLVRGKRDVLLSVVSGYCDIVFANEDEFLALAGGSLSAGMALLEGSGTACVVKLAERGALWSKDGQVCESPVRSMLPFDATGAGDAFSAGFLAGEARGFPPERCLRLGNRIAEEVLRVSGSAADPARLRAAADSVGG